MALVSVVVPNYNKGQFIGETIRSVLSQRFTDFEAIIVDDGSTDNSVEIAQSWAAKDDRVKVFVRDRLPKGGNTCRNIGIQKSTGQWLMFLDSDDLLMPFCLQQRMAAVTQQDETDLGIFPIGTFFKHPGDNASVWMPPTGVNYLHKFLSHDLPWHISSPMWKRETVVNVNGFHEGMNWLQDVEFHTRILLEQKPRIRLYNHLPADCCYRISENRMASGYTGYVTNYVKGQLVYIREMIRLLERNGASSKRRYLKGSVLMAVRMPLFSAAMQRIPKHLEKELLHQVLNDPDAAGLMNTADQMIVKIYSMLYHAGIKRGIDRLFKKLIIR
jgi:Glycosyltransferases involved in cell wall biogenesis